MSVVIAFEPQGQAACPAQQLATGGDAWALIGSWSARDAVAGAVTFTVSAAGSGLAVRAVDAQRGEEAEVSAVTRHGGIVSFRMRWGSDGRICHCALQAVAPDSVQYTLTCIEHAVLQRRA